MTVSLKWRVLPASNNDPLAQPEAGPTDWQRLEASDSQELRKLARRSGLQPLGEAISPGGGPVACLACGHPELFTQRDFPRAVGIVIVILAAVLAPATNYLSLAAAAFLDFLLYHLSRKVVVCYVCRAEHRGFPEAPRHPGFDREIEERLLYGTKAVMGKPMREGGTADAPEPEH